MASNPFIKLRIRQRPFSETIQFDWLGDSHISYIYADYERIENAQERKVDIYDLLPDVRSIAGISSNLIVYSLYNMTKLRNEFVKNAHYTTVHTLHRIIRGFRHNFLFKAGASIPQYIGNVPMLVSATTYMDVMATPDVLRLGINTGLIQILSISEELLEYYNRGWLPTIMITDHENGIYDKEGAVFQIKTNYETIERQIEHFNGGLSNSLISYRNLPVHIVEAAHKYNIFMKIDDIRNLAESVGMLIPRRLNLNETREYFINNLLEYSVVDPEAKITKKDKMSSRFNFKSYPDRVIFTALGVYFSYRSRSEIFDKIKKLFSPSRADVVALVFNSKRVMERHAATTDELISFSNLTDFITKERGVENEEGEIIDTTYWFGNYKNKFMYLLSSTFKDTISSEGNFYLNFDQWAYKTTDDALDLRPFRLDVINLMSDINGYKGEDSEEYIKKKPKYIYNVLEKFKYNGIPEELKIYVATLDPDRRKFLLNLAIRVFEAGMYMRQWYGDGTQYPLIVGNDRSEVSAIDWHFKTLQNQQLSPETRALVEEAVNSTAESGIDNNILLSFMLLYLLKITREIEELSEEEQNIFKLKLFLGASLRYTPKEEETTLYGFLKLIMRLESQYGGCLRAASSKTVYNAAYLIKGLFEIEIPGFNYSQLTNIV